MKFIIFLIATGIVMYILSIVPVNIPKKFRMKIAIVSSMIVLLSILLESLYSIWVSMGIFFGLLLLFSFLLAKELSEKKERDHANEQNFGTSIHFFKRGRIQQARIDQLLKKVQMTEMPLAASARNVNDHSDEANDLFLAQEQKELDDKALDEKEKIEEKLPPRKAVLEETDEETFLLGRQFLLMEKEGLPPLKSELEAIEEEEYLPPRPSSLENGPDVIKDDYHRTDSFAKEKEHNENNIGNDNNRENETIFLKRSEMFKKLEEDLFDDSSRRKN